MYGSQHHVDKPGTRLLVVLGKNIGVGSSQLDIQQRYDHLSRESRLNALAAGLLWTPETDILFSTGQTAGPETPSEAAAMQDYFMRRFTSVPAARLHTEQTSRDTTSNAQYVGTWLRNKHYAAIDLATVGFHLDNAATLFTRHGVPLSQKYASEQIVAGRGRVFAEYVVAWAQSSEIQREHRRERVRRQILKFDRKGNLLHLATRKRRPGNP